MKNTILKTFALLLFISILSIGCKKEKNEEMEEMETISFQSVIDTGGEFAAPEIGETSTVSEVYTEDRDGATWECTTETVNIQDGAGGNGGFPLFSPNSNVIYPGNMLQGGSLNQGTPDIIAVERARGKISTDVVDGNIQSSFEVDKIAKSSV